MEGAHGVIEERVLAFRVDLFHIEDVRFGHDGVQYVMATIGESGNRLVDESELYLSEAAAERERHAVVEKHEQYLDRRCEQDEATRKNRKSNAGHMVSYYRNEIRKLKKHLKEYETRLNRAERT